MNFSVRTARVFVLIEHLPYEMGFSFSKNPKSLASSYKMDQDFRDSFGRDPHPLVSYIEEVW